MDPTVLLGHKYNNEDAEWPFVHRPATSRLESVLAESQYVAPLITLNREALLALDAFYRRLPATRFAVIAVDVARGILGCQAIRLESLFPARAKADRLGMMGS